MLLNRPITTLGHLSLSPLYQMLSTKVSRSALTFVSTIVFFFNSINETSESAKSTFWWFAMGFAKCALCRVCLFTCLFLRIGPLACIFDSKLRHQLGMVQPLVWPPWFYFWKHYLVIQLISLCSVNLSDKSYSLSVPLIVVYSAQSFLLSSTVLCLLGFLNSGFI